MKPDARYISRLVLVGLVALPFLSACGLRGGLVRPDPIFRDVDAIEAVEVEEEVTPNPEVVIRERTNAEGGEIPEPAPVAPVQSTPLDDLSLDDPEPSDLDFNKND